MIELLEPDEIKVTQSIRDTHESKVVKFLEIFQNSDNSEPIEVVEYNKQFYTINGHHRLMAMRVLGKKIIADINKSTESSVDRYFKSLNPDYQLDWEDAVMYLKKKYG